MSPIGTCDGPPDNGNGSDPGVVLEWSENVSASQRIVIQERNATKPIDVIEPGEKITDIYRGDGFSTVLAEDTVSAG